MAAAPVLHSGQPCVFPRDRVGDSSTRGVDRAGRISSTATPGHVVRLVTMGPLEVYERQGYVVLEGLLDANELAAVRSALEPLLDDGPSGRNDFEGTRTRRVYSLVGRGAVFASMVEHPRVLALVDRLLLPHSLLTASQAISVGPGETPQPVHFDDSFYPLPRPRRAISISTIWAIDAFTPENGATEVIAGSHLFDDAQVEGTYQRGGDGQRSSEFERGLAPLEMKAGDCVLFAGTLLHRGGANRTDRWRRAISHQYCEPWARTQETFLLTIPRDRVAPLSPRLRSLLGYSIHGPFMGQIAGRHPEKALKPGWRSPVDDVDTPG